MINTLKHRALLVTAIFMVATPALAQAPTEAQRNAIRSQCRADYQAHCASIPPGGEASLQCLQKNMSSLSPGCASAVHAVDPRLRPRPSRRRRAPKAERRRAAPKPATAPAAATARPAPARPRPKAARRARQRKQPTDAQVSAIRSACRSDYQKVCAGVPTGGAAGAAMPGKEQGEGLGGLRDRPSTPPAAVRARAVAPRRPQPGSGARGCGAARRAWCCGRCGRAKNCSCCGRPAAPTFARCAAGSHPAAAASCNVWRRRPGSISPAMQGSAGASSPRN